jgi:hypothetical protein
MINVEKSCGILGFFELVAFVVTPTNFGVTSIGE